MNKGPIAYIFLIFLHKIGEQINSLKVNQLSPNDRYVMGLKCGEMSVAILFNSAEMSLDITLLMD